MSKSVLSPAAGASLNLPRATCWSGLASLVRERWANWQSRRRVNRLADLDDHILDDIGLTRADVLWACRLPLDRDPTAALRTVALGRRAGLLDGLRR